MEVDQVTISEIEHFSFYKRQWALIFKERLWTDNAATVRGSLAHERVDESSKRLERGQTVLRALDVWSDRHNLFGRADVVEIHAGGVPFPIEYKSGRVIGLPAKLQLAAQALCLEEMFDRPVPQGAVWLGGIRKRLQIVIDVELRTLVLETAAVIRIARTTHGSPMAIYDHRCNQCSLYDECLPQLVQDRQHSAVMKKMLFTEPSESDA
jgi:CRISPR-associated exonuclease Cas4